MFSGTRCFRRGFGVGSWDTQEYELPFSFGSPVVRLRGVRYDVEPRAVLGDTNLWRVY